MHRLPAATLLAATVLAAALSACDSNPADRVLSVQSSGVVIVGAFVDENGDGVLQPSEAAAPGVKVSLVWPGGSTPVASGVTATGGTVVLRDVPVGRYDVLVDTASVGDSLRVTRIDSSVVTLAAGDTARTLVALGYPPASIASVRHMSVGTKVEVEGIALNAWSAFGDSSVYIQDATGFLRATRVRPISVFPGDSVRFVGTVSVLNGQVVITSVTPQVLATGLTAPTPKALSTVDAATANGGTLDAALVKITGASILAIQVDPDGNLVATVDDGSGPVDIFIGVHSAIQVPQAFTPGALLDATGVLSPIAGKPGWALRPRTSADLNATFRSVTIAEARTEPVGRTVQVEGIALNGWATYGDSTVDIVDSTGALRLLQVHRATFFAGDSMRMTGTVAMQNGQVVLLGATPLVLATGRTVPPPHLVSTYNASSASGGTLDAALVKVRSAVIQSTYASQNGNYYMWVDDGTGEVQVVINGNLGLALNTYVVGRSFDITGLLVPTPGGATWMILPRSGSDLVLH